MNRHDAYYEPEDDDLGEFLDERIAELLNTDDYDPTDVGHLSEAISEASTVSVQPPCGRSKGFRKGGKPSV